VDIKLTDDGDLDIGSDFTMKLVSKKEDLVRQRVWIVLNVNRGEWEYDLTFGVPWIENKYNNLSILGKVPQAVLDAEIKRAITTREGVKSIAAYNNKVVNRKGFPEISITTDTGEILKIDQYIPNN